VNATKILNTFYPGASAAGPHLGRTRRLWSLMSGAPNGRKTPKPRKKKWIPCLVVGSLAVAVWIILHLYYYNVLVDLESNVNANCAHIEAQLQRRNHIQQNLTQIVIAYSKYERDTLTELIEMRTGASAGGRAAKATGADRQSPSKPNQQSPPAQLKESGIAKLFPDVRITAEQYPQLKLTENLQQVSASIIDTEKQIAEQIITYNQSVNAYTTVLEQFPGNIVGATFGFKMYDYYQPDKEVLKFTPVKY
jgi:LemA protein